MIQVAAYFQPFASNFANNRRGRINISKIVSRMIYQGVQRLEDQSNVIGHDRNEMPQSSDSVLEFDTIGDFFETVCDAPVRIQCVRQSVSVRQPGVRPVGTASDTSAKRTECVFSAAGLPVRWPLKLMTWTSWFRQAAWMAGMCLSRQPQNSICRKPAMDADRLFTEYPPRHIKVVDHHVSKESA